MMRIVCILIIALSVITGTSIAQKFDIERVDPPFWFSGFERTQLQLVVYGKGVARAEVSLKSSSYTIDRLVQTGNPNYVFVYLDVLDPGFSGQLNIQFKSRRTTRQLQYEIIERKPKSIGQGSLESNDAIYLVFPDRFANGEVSNDIVSGMNETTVNRDSMFYRHGGDLQGVINKLDYIEDLGFTALWLNPVIENDQPEESYHGYAATDVYKVDPRFGSNNDYLRLSTELEERGMKLIMDVVLNHWGNEHYMIKDLPNDNWLNNWDEFTRTTYRAPTLLDPYAAKSDQKLMTDGWFDHHMPDLNQRNPLLADYLIQNHIWWIEYAGIDAIRIDTYAYPDQQFMKDWAAAIKLEYPDIGMFGETWVHGSPVQSWFVDNANVNRYFDNSLDAVTDFQLYYAINKALTEAEGWTEGSQRLYYTLAKDVLYENPEKLVTFLDNHDLSRFYSMVNEDLDSYKMGIGFLLSTRGIPCIYYGTEILMKNYADPDGKVREDFPGGWPDDEVNKFEKSGRTDEEKEAFRFLKKLLDYRKQNPSNFKTDHELGTGKLIQYVPENGIYVYFRKGSSSKLMITMNFNREESTLDLERFNEEIGDGQFFYDIIDEKEIKGRMKLTLPKRSIKWIQVDN